MWRFEDLFAGFEKRDGGLDVRPGLRAGVSVERALDRSDALLGFVRRESEGGVDFEGGGTLRSRDLEDESSRIPEAYGDNYPRLSELKAKFDPDNFFSVNQNIKSAIATSA